MIRTLVLIVGFFFAGVMAYATYKENYSISNYDECILKSMKNAKVIQKDTVQGEA